MLSYILFAAPILLIIIIGMLIRLRGNSETTGRRYFLFLIWTAIGSLALVLLNWILPRSVFGYVMVLFPIIPGLVALTFMHWREWKALSNRAKIPIVSAFVLLAILAVAQIVAVSLKSEVSQLEPILFGLVLLSVTAYLLIAWTWGYRYPALLGVFALLYLMFFNVTEMGALSLPSESMPGWLNVLGTLAYLALPGFTIPVMAILTVNLLDAIQASEDPKPTAWHSVFGKLILVLFLFASLLYTFRWLWIWDGMDDGIRVYFMMVVSVIAAISGTLMIMLTVSGLRRWAGLIFSMVVIGSIYYAILTGFGLGEESAIYTVTEERALRIRESIEDYRTKNGSYPMELDDLVPGELWRIPAPRIMPEQNWCYEAGPDYYRLGAVYREHWSSPYLSVRVYGSAGDTPETSWVCDEKLAEAMSQSGFFGPPPTPVPQPTSAVSVPRVIVEPVLKADSFSMGSWSPDGAYLVFGLTEYFMDEVEHVTIDLRFLEAQTGNMCQPNQSQWTVQKSDGLRDHSAWLPDGRFLFVTDAGEMLAFQPCADDVEDLASRFPVKFTHVMSSDEQGERVLLKNEEAYWLLDGISLEARMIADVPAEMYWSWYDWSPGGGRLAISKMSGPEVEDEAFLYIVDWASAQVEKRIPLEGASDANLPIVEWLTRDELLIHGNTLTVMDFRSEPPALTDVLRDIFLLDIAYPDDVSGMDTGLSKDGEVYFIGVQVNHPKNKDAYVYSSETRQVEVFQQDVSTMIFFEDGQWMRLIKWEDEPSYRDEYLMVWMDQSNTETMLKIEGHVPRAHPQIFPRYLPVSSQLYVSSSQGISLVSLPDGRTVAFWDLSSDADYFSVIAAPNGEALIVESTGVGLYYIPIPPR